MSELDQKLETTSATNNNGKSIPENLPEESIDFALLRLDSFNSSANTTTTSATATNCHTPCTACGCSGSTVPSTNVFSSYNKRRSPELITPSLDPQDQIPKKPKKLFLEPHENTNITSTSPSLRDFSKITLPCTSSLLNFGPAKPIHTNSLPVLRRCHSDPYSPPVAGLDTHSGSGTGSSANLLPQSPPESAKTVGATAVATPGSKAAASLPPRPPMLRRTVSDPSPNKSFSRSSSCDDVTVDESPQYKWLRKMRDCMKEMNQWCVELMPGGVMGEDEQEDKGTQGNTANATKAGSVIEYEEAVCVERTGECLVVHFKCPCGKGYQILLSGRDCYYKLI
ncbi:hypothetical protein GH714_005547 [Hevea brasiliensis]|uniref:Uncharacterized protein n=1 Tax=Hevea brasiliensis TaxID=3981 RepID=A0A6A6K9U1_HEVBR|nr:hypothetical protein GH714_005547 [Hevea brasiliensis]